MMERLERSQYEAMRKEKCCPKGLCFLWDEEKQRCDEYYKTYDEIYDCIRRNPKGTDDFYEPNLPELTAAGLPRDFFGKPDMTRTEAELPHSNPWE